ncbi:carbon dioxide-concentrating protein CcmK, partial [filamentous cyanobacterium CCP5]
GVIEVRGMPAALEVADVMTKAAQVQFVRFDTLAAGLVSVIVRGATGEVQTSVQAGVDGLRRNRASYAGHHVIPCPDGNVEAVLPIVGGSGSDEWLID